MTGNLTFGYLYDFRNPREFHRSPAELYAETLDVIAETERLGFTGAWVPEHHLADDGYMPSPMLALAAIAARTRTIRIGSAVGLGPLYDPLRFAEDCAVLDILSNGRVEMGLAIGYRRREYAAMGLDFGKRGARFDEFLSIVRRLWDGETVDFEGAHFRLQGARVEPRSPRGQIPLFIGGFAPKALQRVAKYGDGYFGNEEVCETYLDALVAQGKDPSHARIWLQNLMLVVARDKQAAIDELAPYFHQVSNAYGAWMNEDNAIGLANAALKPMDLDAFKRSHIMHVMTPDEAIDHFRAQRGRVPVEHVMLMRPPGLPADRFLDYAGLFASEVIPAFR
ncbi:LLM class flavin-dependent oxidoreductase [Novosphingobium album (ex Liu et al. 2023)]|uniref:LLM class flavin-dependent oxidoreductase n=1 Tax=Novosphingobium album (ex Liu et al. 2023) TaxID=3031130 RepID=A0ABT5WJD9_9SPHN|nr:LLM class flavin-dependent oxidoreductase [Novosphingobium album (ex Liu et al. 2023)]MDE8650162.1 LLM class flavin-dependent oxidoreductase [Novosphingobium album (ex Liu et al. 2023)]